MEQPSAQQKRVGYFLLAAFYLMAFLIVPSNGDPYSSWIFPRVIALSSLGAIGFVLFRSWKDLPTFPLILIALYFLGVLVSNALSADEKAYLIIGHEERYDGLLYQIALFLWLSSAWRIFRLLNKMALIRFAVSGLVLLGILQAILVGTYLFLNIDIIGFILYQGAKNTYPIGTLGFKALVTLSTGTAAILVAMLSENRWPQKPLIFFLGLSTGLAAGRAALIGAMSSSGLGAIIASTKKRYTLLLLFASIIAGALLRDPSAQILRQKKANVLSAHTLETRFKIWDLSLHILKKHRWLVFYGLGSDALRYALIKDLPRDPILREKLSEFLRLEERIPTDHIEKMDIAILPKYGLRSTAIQLHFVNKETGRESIFLSSIVLDRAHNLLLDLWLRYGLIAALSYFFFAFGPIVTLFNEVKRRRLLNIQILIALSLVLVLHFFHYLAWFTMPLWEPYFLTISLLAWHTWLKKS